MRSLGVIVVAPFGDLIAGVAEGSEPVQVQALVAHAAVKTLNERVLHRFARLDEPQANPGALRPVEHCTARAFRPVVENDLFR